MTPKDETLDERSLADFLEANGYRVRVAHARTYLAYVEVGPARRRATPSGFGSRFFRHRRKPGRSFIARSSSTEQAPGGFIARTSPSSRLRATSSGSSSLRRQDEARLLGRPDRGRPR